MHIKLSDLTSNKTRSIPLICPTPNIQTSIQPQPESIYTSVFGFQPAKSVNNHLLVLPDGKTVNITQNHPQLTSQQKLHLQSLEMVDPKFYLRAYPDLKSNIEPISHYSAHGKNENRLPNADKFVSLYPNFQIEIYRENNQDIVKKIKTNEELMAHFHHHGRLENRISNQTTQDTISQSQSQTLSTTSHLSSSTLHLSSTPHLSSSTLHLSSASHLSVPPKAYIDYEGLKNINLESINRSYEISLNPKLREIISHNHHKKNKKPIYLVMAEWGYPPFGGGECWLMDTMKWLFEQGFNCYYIYFYDHVNKSEFTQINLINVDYGIFIQFPQNYLELLQFIKLLNPKVISHQGLNRLKYLQIANLLEKPFITGFCFWQDILKMENRVDPLNPYNKNMINKTLIADANFKLICQNSAYAYVCGQFVNDIVKKVHNINIDVINTITDDFHYKIKTPILTSNEAVYVTVINICGLKGGQILESLINSTSLQIPFLLIDSQESSGASNLRISQLIEQRNQFEKKHKSCYIRGAQNNIRPIYQKTRILLIPSLVDETFCRVAYEGMMNQLPILSTNNGNLKYILKDYADFLDEIPKTWSDKINLIYDNDTYLQSMSLRPSSIDSYSDKNKFVEQVYRCIANHSGDYYKNHNIGILCPWGDQGLGIQCREYYDILRKLGYVVSIFSFKPYNSHVENPRLQTDPTEWNYPNIHYSLDTRENITLKEFMTFVHHYKIKKIVIVETCFNRVFEIAQMCQLLSIKTYAIPNVEILKSTEIARHNLFDKIICNNQMIYDLLTPYFPTQTILLGFRILNANFINNKEWDHNHYSFFCCGGLNSLTRKNIAHIVQAFKELETENKINRFKLYIYIQGVQIPDNLMKYASTNIIIQIGSRTYKEIAELYKKHDVFIHMGDHEGLGLGFYESIACGMPVLTINTPPNNEVIREGQNGWLVPCTYEKMNDNADGIVKKAVITVKDLKIKMIEVIETYNRKINYDLTTQDYATRFPIVEYTDRLRTIFA